MNVSGKRIAIFGCGYLGQRVAVEALRRGMEVTALTRNPGQAEILRTMGVSRAVVAELDGADWHSEIERRQDFLLNSVSSAGNGWEGYRKSYLTGMESVLRWAEGCEAQAMVFTSSTSVYAQNDGGWISEEDLAEGSNEGGRILREAEDLLLQGGGGIGRRFALRLGGIYGPGRHHLLSRALRAEIEEEEGDEIYLNPIYVHDACGAVWAAFGAPESVNGGIFNVVDDEPVPRGEIVRWLHDEARRLGVAGKEQDSETRRRRRGGVRPNRRISNRRAKEFLGWRLEFPNYRAGYAELLE